MLVAVEVELPQVSPSPLAAVGEEWVRNASRFIEARLQAVSSRNMYSEHGLLARIGPEAGQVCQSLTVVWYCRPGSAQAQAAWPIFSHRLARLDRLGDLAGLGAPEQIPVGVGLDRLEELVGDAHRIVGVLAGDGEIGVRIPVGVVDREVDVGIALLGELDHALDVVVRHVGPARGLDLAPQHRVLLRIEAVVARALAVHAGLQDRLEVLLVDLRAGDEGGDLLLLDHLPVDELLDVGMIGVDDHHLGGAPRGAARLDGAGGAVADLEEAHQAGGLAAAGEPLAFAAQPREVRAGAGAVFEQARLAHPQIHDPAFVDEIVGDRLDEAGVRLRMLVGGLRLRRACRS